ncbi:MAG: ROK family protein [Ignavibacteriales bacterium]|nr:ROK family protein [Ignavibacteriales bacterium]
MNPIEVTIGIDIGGTNTVLGFVSHDGQCLASASMPTWSQEPAKKYFIRLHEKIEETIGSLSVNVVVKGIGIGAPNANYFHGTVESPPNLKWEGVTHVVDILHQYYDCPIAITNDANAAAIGEMVFGSGKGLKHFVVITLGTGLGSGIIVDGKLLYGADGFAGEIGHTIVDPAGRVCGCGRNGCLETYVSANGIRRTVAEMICNSTKPSELRKVSFEECTSKLIYEAAMRGDTIALEAFAFTGEILGMKLADTVAHLSPEAIILFGGLASAGKLIFEPTSNSLERHLLGIFKNKVKILPSGLPEGNSAVIGASALIWHEIDRVI